MRAADMGRTIRTARLLVLAAGWATAAFALALLLAAAAPLAVGDRAFVVRSGSMAPAIAIGDVAVVESIAPTAANVGDVVTFKDPHGRLTSHRARSIVRAGGEIRFTTQGDANSGQEHWKVPADGRIGRVVYRVPKLGFAVVQISSTAGRIALIIVPAVLLAGSLLVAIWRRREDADASAA
jgi:signal peptidase